MGGCRIESAKRVWNVINYRYGVNQEGESGKIRLGKEGSKSRSLFWKHMFL